MAAHFHDSPIPRYLQLADLMRQRIARGTWAAGARLPSLEALVGEFGVARVTVRQAVELLSREGLVSPQQGRGTFVTGRPKDERWFKVSTTLDALAELTHDTEPRLVSIDESPPAPPLRSDDGTPAPKYVFMRRIHARAGEPYCVINIHLDRRIFRRQAKRFRAETVIPLLLAMKDVTIARARQVLTIGTADLELAGMLGIAMNAPVAEVRRVITDAEGTVIYLAEVTYRADAIHVEMDLKP